MMFELKACIVCFSASGCLEDIDSGNLRALFGSVAGFQPDSCLMKPHYLCTECSHLVKLCYEFRAKCSSANLALKQHMMMKSLQVGTQQISVQNVQVPQVTQHLICLNYDSKDLECEVKLEPLATPPYGAPADEHWGDAAKEEHRDETDLHTEDAAPQQAARVSSEVIWQTKQVENYKSETDVGLKTITLSCGVCRNTSKIKGDKIFLKKKKMMVYNFVCEVCLPLVKSDWHTYKKCFGEQNNEHTITNKMLKNFERVKDPKDFLKYSPVSQEEQYRLIQDRQYKRNTNSKFKCPLCYKACTFINSYANHMKKHDPISGNFQCDVCKVYRLSKRKLKEHMEKCHIYKWTCVVEGCSFVCYSRVNAVKHYKYHKDTTFTCKYCGLIFKKETSLFSHLRLKHPERNLLCSLCGFGFVSDFGLRTHRKRVHTKEEIDQLENFVVDPESDLYCEHCKVQFLSGIAYAEHAKSSCKLFFVESEQSNSIKPGESRRYNRRTVSNPKAICEVCGKSVFKGLLKLHIRTHTGEKPFACPHCDRRFNASFNRDRHLRTHTGEKPFMCHHCSRSFSGKNAMKCHIQTVHLKIPYEPWVRSAQKRRLAKLENAMEPSGAI